MPKIVTVLDLIRELIKHDPNTNITCVYSEEAAGNFNFSVSEVDETESVVMLILKEDED